MNNQLKQQQSSQPKNKVYSYNVTVTESLHQEITALRESLNIDSKADTLRILISIGLHHIKPFAG